MSEVYLLKNSLERICLCNCWFIYLYSFQGESAELAVLQPPFLAVRSNPSRFVVFSIVRLCVLEKETCEGTHSCFRNASIYTDSESEDDDENYSEGSKVPKVSNKYFGASRVCKLNLGWILYLFYFIYSYSLIISDCWNWTLQCVWTYKRKSKKSSTFL